MQPQPRTTRGRKGKEKKKKTEQPGEERRRVRSARNTVRTSNQSAMFGADASSGKEKTLSKGGEKGNRQMDSRLCPNRAILDFLPLMPPRSLATRERGGGEEKKRRREGGKRNRGKTPAARERIVE